MLNLKCITCSKEAEYMYGGYSFCKLHMNKYGDQMREDAFRLAAIVAAIKDTLKEPKKRGLGGKEAR